MAQTAQDGLALESARVERPATEATAGTETVWASLRKPTGWVLILLVVYAVARNVAAASAAPLWYDEILTWTVAKQESWGRILKALWEGVDGQPFLFYVIEHIALQIVPGRELALRLPSALAFAVIMVCVFLFVRRRAGEKAALLAAAFLLVTSVFHRYGSEARPYSLEVACIAAAMVFYQRVEAPYRAVGLGAALGLAQAFHHYAIFAATPFAVAEAVYLWRRGGLRSEGIRWRVWMAIACPLIPLGLAWPIVSHFKGMYGAHFWAQYSLKSLPETYGGFVANGVVVGMSLAVLSAAAILARLFLRPKNPGAGASAEEWGDSALLAGLLLLPPVTFLATKVLHGGMLDRYVLAAVLAVAIGIGCIPSVAKPLAVLVIAALAVLIGGREVIFWREVDFKAAERFAQADEALIERAGRQDLPVVVADGHLFLPLQLYALPEEKKRFVFVADEGKALKYVQTDSVDKNLLHLVEHSVQVQSWSSFSHAWPEFLLLEERPRSPFNWLSSYLRASPNGVRVLSEGENRTLLSVKIGAAVRSE